MELDLGRVRAVTDALEAAVESESIDMIVHGLHLAGRAGGDFEGDLDDDERDLVPDEVALAFELQRGTRGLLATAYADGARVWALLEALRDAGEHEIAAALAEPWKRAARALIDTNREMAS